jgi:hypothetical protein
VKSWEWQTVPPGSVPPEAEPPTAERLPTAVHSSTLKLSGVELRCHVLDDGRRIIDADDLARLFEAWGNDVPLHLDEVEQIAAFIRGKELQ